MSSAASRGYWEAERAHIEKYGWSVPFLLSSLKTDIPKNCEVKSLLMGLRIEHLDASEFTKSSCRISCEPLADLDVSLKQLETLYLAPLFVQKVCLSFCVFAAWIQNRSRRFLS